MLVYHYGGWRDASVQCTTTEDGVVLVYQYEDSDASVPLRRMAWC